jgi:hypothetical protein
MYKVYLLAVLIGSVAFVASYIPVNKSRVAREKAFLAEQVIVAKQMDERRRLDEEAARKADRERREAREKEDADRLAKKEADEDAQNEQIRVTIAETNSKLKDLSADLDKRRKELEVARQARITLQTQVFDLKKGNELSRIQLRTAQLESQRALDFVAGKVGATPTLLLPPPPPPAAAPKS